MFLPILFLPWYWERQLQLPACFATGVPLFGVDAVHAPFDYVALDQEIELFQTKATAEGALIKAVRTNSYEGLAATVEETRGVIAKLQQAPADTSQKALEEVCSTCRPRVCVCVHWVHVSVCGDVWLGVACVRACVFLCVRVCGARGCI